MLRIYCCLLAAGALLAQGEFRLTVTDSSGAAMPAGGTWNARRFSTDGKGAATFSNLTAGEYRLTVSRPGFETQTLTIAMKGAESVARTVALSPAAANSAIDVVDATPLPGMNLTRDEMPAPVQGTTARDFESTNAIDIADLMNRRLQGVYVNEIQGNPMQPDVNYRGYTASPLLGTPQGLSIYMDGVRLNQPFGDVMSWDLLPRIAIAETVLMPGSNPLFGLNTLGGALAIHTKTGQTQPGTAVQVSGGSFGRKMADMEHGGAAKNGMHWYAAGNLFFEDGWRESSPSNVRQFFSKIGRQRERTAVAVTAAYANNALNGNGLGEMRDLARRYTSIYTKPDITTNRAPFLNFTASHLVTSRVRFSGNGYYRYIRNTSYNGDINEDSLDQAVYQPSAADIRALTRAGFTGFPASGANASNTPFPFWRCLAQAIQKDEPAEKCNGLINRSRTGQHNYGAAGQVTATAGKHEVTAGAALDRSHVDFRQMAQLGYLNPDRSVTGVDAFGDSVNGGESDGEPFDTRVDLEGKIRTASAYATGKVAMGNAVLVTLSGRYNNTRIENFDRIRPAAGRGSLTGRHSFQRFNPAAGITYSPAKVWNVYFSYSEGNRAPTSIELGCADPEAPCKLPNAMAGDPPLAQVVTRSFEGGARGQLETRWNWAAGVFHADNTNDILFVASPQTGYGYFKNFGKTRRQGAEFQVNGRAGRVTMGAGYTLLRATYQSVEQVNGESNSTNDEALEGEKGLEGLIRIEPGNQIPLIPRHMVKVFADMEATKRLTLHVGVVGVSGAYARGNENNRHAPDAPYYLGPGRSEGYAVVNTGARYRAHRRLEFFAQVNNLFDRRYYTGAQLGPTGFDAAGNFSARPLPAVDGEFPVVHTTFFAPGAPRGAWGGARVRF
ncbi:MAG: TonB-dependent receptor [Bryobacterales bacterium]|nr:TonB-dependent receptor [Bryobacterales bacterium]